MAKSLKSQLSDHEKELTTIALNAGVLAASHKAGEIIGHEPDLICFQRYVREITGKDVPLATKAHVTPGKDLFYSFIDALFRKYSEIENDNARLREQLTELRQQEYQREQTAKLQLMEMANSIGIKL